MFPGMSYSSETFPFPAGSRLLFYTDGLTEVSQGEEEFGSERLVQAFLESSSSNAPQILESLWETLASFSTNAQQVDDMTALAICHLDPLQQELATP